MSLEKGIKHKKEWRKPFRGSKRFDSTCRNHGSCGYCEGNRTFFDKKKRYSAQIDEKIFDWNEDLEEVHNGV
jgi:hypothetical protein